MVWVVLFTLPVVVDRRVTGWAGRVLGMREKMIRTICCFISYIEVSCTKKGEITTIMANIYTIQGLNEKSGISGQNTQYQTPVNIDSPLRCS